MFRIAIYKINQNKSISNAKASQCYTKPRLSQQRFNCETFGLHAETPLTSEMKKLNFTKAKWSNKLKCDFKGHVSEKDHIHLSSVCSLPKPVPHEYVEQLLWVACDINEQYFCRWWLTLTEWLMESIHHNTRLPETLRDATQLKSCITICPCYSFLMVKLLCSLKCD